MKGENEMLTICTNKGCQQKYRVRSDLVGCKARCAKCETVFEIVEYEEKSKVVKLDFEDEVEDQDMPVDESIETRKRRSTREVMDEHMENIRVAVDKFLPRLEAALERQENESDTRLLITKMLQRVLGYNLEDIKTEQKIEGRRADYVLSINDIDVLIIEAKKIGMALRDRQIFQATSYGAYAGIKWAILTNAVVWQLYHISTAEKVETDLVFTIDLRDGIDAQEAHFFYLISKTGMSRKNLLDKLWQKISALCYDNIISAILTEDVVSKIRTTLSKQTGCRLSNDELRAAIEENIFQLV